MSKSIVSCFLTHSVPISVVPPCLFVHHIGSDVVWCYCMVLLDHFVVYCSYGLLFRVSVL